MNKVTFEIVHTDAGYHARVKGGNGEPVWWTETYVDRGGAETAIQFLLDKVSGIAFTANLVDERTVQT